jgi:peptidoglycan hydrolase-like protein with peptidoglycan-binding domain
MDEGEILIEPPKGVTGMSARSSPTRSRFRLICALLVIVTTAPLGVFVGASAAAASARAEAAATAAVRPTIRYGARGAAVVYLQQRLTALRYDVGAVDGIFGYNTLHGVQAFQKVQRIGVDGVVGPITWGRLASPVVPRARYNRAAASVEVDLTRRVVYLTRAGAVTRILDASPGKASTPTPTGAFTITRRINGWRQSDLGLLWRPNYFYRGYALHGSTSVPTYAASHGCVRVTVPAMNRIWASLTVGERFYVYR